MKYRNWMVVVIAAAFWAVMPRGLARAQGISYVNCSTGAPPYTPTTVAPSSSAEQQVSCNPGDTAVGGGIEVLSPSLPLPLGVLVITPENSFLFTDSTATGWQVVLQNINLLPYCFYPKASEKSCPPVEFRVCVSCLTPPV